MKIVILSSNLNPDNNLIRNIIEDFQNQCGHEVEVVLIDGNTDWLIIDDMLSNVNVKLIGNTRPVKNYSNYNNLKLRELF